jgi:hypothetical protein
MRAISVVTCSLLLLFGVSVSCTPSPSSSQEEVDPPREEVDPSVTEVWEPEPTRVDAGKVGEAPSDAIVLFDGTDLSEWRGKDGAPAWEVEDGVLTVVPETGTLTTTRAFGDVQLHLEWRSPAEIAGEGQGRGNSGVFLMDLYEVQILDSYDNRTYSNGQAGSIYKQFIPEVNATRPPGEWQSYDIIFMAPRFDSNGALERPATMTVLHNGVLIQNHVTLRGPTEYRGEPEYRAHAAKLPLTLQDHTNPVSFRNIWIRELQD